MNVQSFFGALRTKLKNWHAQAKFLERKLAAPGYSSVQIYWNSWRKKLAKKLKNVAPKDKSKVFT
jgi:hypothetical protein